jgi:4-hydroxybenzoate polyprenyltransferase
MIKNKTLPQKLGLFFWSTRPISWINTAFPFAAGYLASGGSVSLQFLITTLYFLIPYNALIYVVNDVFDYESDLRNPRKGGIEGALLPPSLHRFMLLATAFLNLPFVIYILLQGTLSAKMFFTAILFGALSYSIVYLRFKERPFLDSINSSFHFVSPLVYAFLILQLTSFPWHIIGAFFFWGIASHAFGAVQDIRADREAKIHSIATFLGASSTVRVSLFFYLLASVLLLFAGGKTAVVAVTGLMYILMVLPYINLKNNNCEQANRGWKHFIKINQVTGFVVTILLILENFAQ